MYLDHARLTLEDLGWLTHVERLTLWAVDIQTDLLRDIPRLSWLSLRGGSAVDLSAIDGCNRLRYLQINQIRGLTNIDPVADIASLQFLSLYGQPGLVAFPSLVGLIELRRVELGSLKGLLEVSGMLEAPGIEELYLIKMVRLSPGDIDLLAAYTPLRHFYWLGEDVADKVWVPVRDRLALPPAETLFPEEWFTQRGLSVP